MKFLQDGPNEQVISCEGDRIPSFLPNGLMAGCSAEDFIRVAEATISRKAECIVITWCSTVMLKCDLFFSYHVGFSVYRGGEVVAQSLIPLFDYSYERVHGQFVFCVTLRRKHSVVEAIKPGDKLSVFITKVYRVFLKVSLPEPKTTIRTLEANVCVVYDGGGHLLLEVNSELLSKDASRQLEEQFGRLVLSHHGEGAFIANI